MKRGCVINRGRSNIECANILNGNLFLCGERKMKNTIQNEQFYCCLCNFTLFTHQFVFGNCLLLQFSCLFFSLLSFDSKNCNTINWQRIGAQFVSITASTG